MRGGLLEVPWPPGARAQVELLPAGARRRLALRRAAAQVAAALVSAAAVAAAVAAAHVLRGP